MRVRGAVGVVAVALLTAMGVAGSASAVPAKSTPDGYHRAKVKAAGLAIAVPDTWLELDPKSASFDEAISRAAELNPQLASILDQVNASRSSIYFMAIDPSAEEGFNANLNVTPLPIPRSLLNRPAQVRSALAPQFEQVGAQDLRVEKTKVAGKSALLATATLPLTAADGSPVLVHSTIYLVPTKKGVVQLTFSTRSDGRDDPTVQTMIGSLKQLR